MRKIQLRPNQSGYAVQYGQTNIQTSFESGRSRFRQDMINPNHIVNVEWFVTEIQVQYLKAFYNTSIKGGGLPFLIDLVIDNGDLTEHEAHFIPNSLQLGDARGLTYSMTAQLEIKPIAVNDELNESIVLMYELYGTNTSSILNWLDIIVNTDFPKAIPNE